MGWLPRLLFALTIALSATNLLAGEDGADASLARARARLAEDARAYRESLERLLAVQEQIAARAADVAGARRRLYEQGIVSRAELLASESADSAARAEVGGTRQRIAEAESALSEAQAALDLPRVAPGPSTAMVPPDVTGSLDLASIAVRDLDQFFASRFARPLPVSARGQTPVHDRLGLDHRQAVDVAVHPDSEEGRAIIEYLQRHHIPFLAFRGALPGSSTGAHVHVGRASARVVPASGHEPLRSSTSPGPGR